MVNVQNGAVRKWAGRLGRGIAGVNLAALIRLARFGPRDAARRVAASYAAADPLGKRPIAEELFDRIPTVSIHALAQAKNSVDIDPRFVDTPGALPLYQLQCLLMLAKDQNPGAVLEIGTFYGSTTANLAKALPSAKIHTIDLPPEYSAQQAGGILPKDDFHLIESRRVGAAFAGTPQAANIKQHFGDTATYDFASIPDPINFFFIDGSHTYEYARSDTLRCMAIARGPSTFLWHDCDAQHLGVVQWLAEMIDAGFPVVRIARTAIACARIDPLDGQTKHKVAALSGTGS